MADWSRGCGAMNARCVFPDRVIVVNAKLPHRVSCVMHLAADQRCSRLLKGEGTLMQALVSANSPPSATQQWSML
eukprot:13898875-Alexandrium_andersonii.AAC.1